MVNDVKIIATASLSALSSFRICVNPTVAAFLFVQSSCLNKTEENFLSRLITVQNEIRFKLDLERGVTHFSFV